MVKRNHLWMIAAILTCGLMTTGCVESDNPAGGDSNSQYTNIVEPSFFASNIDMNTYAGDNFYEYATGQWLDNHPLKAMESSNGSLAEQSAKTNEFYEAIEGMADKDPVIARLKADFDDTQEVADKEMLKDKLDLIDAAADGEALYAKMAGFMKEGYFMPYMLIDAADERKISLSLRTFESEKDFSLLEEQLEQYMPKTEAKLSIEKINAFKKLLKEKNFFNKTPSHSHHIRDLQPINTAGTRAGQDNFPLKAVVDKMGLPEKVASKVTSQGWKEINQFVSGMSLAELKAFCKYFIVHRDIDFIAYTYTKFSYYIKALGNSKFSPIAIRLSALYDGTIPADNRAAAIEIANQFRQTFKERVTCLSWMSEATKTKAIEKIDAMEFFIGWLDDDSKRKEWVVQLPAAEPNGRRSFYWDACDLFKQNVAIIIAKAEEASTDTRDIFYAEQMECPSYDANAFYDGKVNCMLILSTNLLPPIFDPNWPDAVNYAVIGASTIGHEITHGFDTEGRLRGKTGAKEDWMLPQDATTFKNLTDKMKAHFNTLSWGDTYQCNGATTLAENVADLGGIYIAYEAFTKLLDKKGITGAERDRQCREFFRGFAYAWMGNISEAGVKKYLTDEHSIPPLRVNGNVYLMNEFYRLFGITGGKMYLAPADRIEIW